LHATDGGEGLALIWSRISVIPFHGAERYGTFVSNDSESFTFHDIDDKTDVTLKHSDVRKLKQGYGGYNSISGKHTDRKRGIIGAVVIVGVVFGVLFGALATEKDQPALANMAASLSTNLRAFDWDI
jgi:hypothetical protein